MADNGSGVMRSPDRRDGFERAMKVRAAYTVLYDGAHDLGLWYFQVLADLFGKSIHNLGMAGNSRCLHVRWIIEDRQCASHPLEETCTHASPDGEAVSVASSDNNLDFFSNEFLAC